MKPYLLTASAAALFIALTAQTQAAVSLGTSANFGVLAGTTVTNTGGSSVLGSIGVAPGTAITGFFGTTANDGPGIFSGSAHQGDAIAGQAQADALAAFNTLNGLAVNTSAIPADLGGQTLGPGVYSLGSAGLTGTLTLDGAGDYVFQIGSTLTTATSSSIQFLNGADASQVFWAVGSSATLGTGTDFAGNIIALTSIDLVTGASLDGRAIALNGAVTMNDNSIIPEPSTMMMMAMLPLGLILRRQRTSR